MKNSMHKELVIYEVYNEKYDCYSYFSDRSKAISYQKFRLSNWKEKTKLTKIIVNDDLIEMEPKS